MGNKATNANTVSVTRETISNVTVGNATYQIARSADNRSVTVRNAEGGFTLPTGEVGQAIAKELLAMATVAVEVKAKRKRRSKAEIEATKAENSPA
jgi:hypothetical protein